MAKEKQNQNAKAPNAERTSQKQRSAAATTKGCSSSAKGESNK